MALGDYFKNIRRGAHTLVQVALILFAVGAIVFPSILSGRYTQAYKAVTNTTTPCYDDTGKDNFDECVKKGVSISDRFKNAVYFNFNESILGKSSGGVSAEGDIIYDGCGGGGKWVSADPDEAGTKTCLGTWAVDKTEQMFAFDGSSATTPIQCKFEDADMANIDFDTALKAPDLDKCKAGTTTVTLESCGIQCASSGGAITKMSVGFFLEHFTLNNKRYNELLTDYITKYVEPVPFDGKHHTEPYRAIQNLYRNMREISIARNFTMQHSAKLANDNTKLQNLVEDLTDVSQNYYAFLNTRTYVIVITVLAALGPVCILLSEYGRNTNKDLLDNSFTHWLYTASYFSSTFLAIVFFGVVTSGEYHIGMFRSLDKLMKDADVPLSATNQATIDEGYTSSQWQEFDQPSLLQHLRAIALWWQFTFFCVLLSLTAHLSVKLGPLMRLVKVEVDNFTTAARAPGPVASKVPTAAKYLPLVSVVRT